MTAIGYYHYEGFDLRTKFGWINGAAGLQATEPARIGMGNVGNAFSESDDAIRRLLAPQSQLPGSCQAIFGRSSSNDCP